MIPILDLTRQHRELESDLTNAVLDVLRGGAYVNGPRVARFEREFAAYAGVEHAVGLNSGTDALYLALRALDIGPGDEVVTTPFTFAATSETIGATGATPVFADIDAATFNIDAAAVAAAITSRTRAIVPVHLYGRPAPMHELLAIAAKNHLAVVEDCAQSVGASIGGTRAGAFGTIGAFSFFPSRNLGACGDGGIAVTRDAALAERMRRLRAHGAAVKYRHDELGVNSRLDELQAAILSVKLPHLEDWIAARRRIAASYRRLLDGISGIDVPADPAGARHVYHQFTIRVAADRDRVASDLASAGVQTAIYYPVPLHLQRVHERLGLRLGAFPAAERAAQEALSLPIFPEMLDAEVEAVAAALRGKLEVACAS